MTGQAMPSTSAALPSTHQPCAQYSRTWYVCLFSPTQGSHMSYPWHSLYCIIQLGYFVIPICQAFSSKAMVPNLFGTRDRYLGRQFFHQPRTGDGFRMI